MEKMSRRSFLKAGTAATAALAMTPTEMLAKAKNTKKKAGKTGKVKLLGVGIGGRGHIRPLPAYCTTPNAERFRTCRPEIPVAPAGFPW